MWPKVDVLILVGPILTFTNKLMWHDWKGTYIRTYVHASCYGNGGCSMCSNKETILACASECAVLCLIHIYCEG